MLKIILEKGYIGLGIITPAKKPAHGELTDSDKRNNTAINRVRYLIERVIVNLKTWRVLTHRLPPPLQHLRNHQYKPSPDSSSPTPHE